MELKAAQLIEATGCKPEVASTCIAPLNIAMARFGISTAPQVAAFVAQLAHESSKFTRTVENLNYSADGLANTWPARYGLKFADGSYARSGARILPNRLAQSIHRNPELIANLTYADRMGNGNPSTGDGWKYRGRGYIQLTGKQNYIACGDVLGLDLVNSPDTLERPLYAALAAGWYWARHGLSRYANDPAALTKAINGGYNGLAERKSMYDEALRVLGSSEA